MERHGYKLCITILYAIQVFNLILCKWKYRKISSDLFLLHVKVFQRRNRGATDFYRNWSSYRNGFGDIQDEFWLGNDKLHFLTQQGTYELRVDFVTSSNSAKYAKYSSFRIDSESTKYRVTSISGYSGNGCKYCIPFQC